MHCRSSRLRADARIPVSREKRHIQSQASPQTGLAIQKVWQNDTVPIPNDIGQKSKATIFLKIVNQSITGVFSPVTGEYGATDIKLAALQP